MNENQKHDICQCFFVRNKRVETFVVVSDEGCENLVFSLCKKHKRELLKELLELE